MYLAGFGWFPLEEELLQLGVIEKGGKDIREL